MNPAITNLVVMIGMTQVSKKIPFEDPTVLLAVRIAYVLSNIIIIGLYLYVRAKINAKKDLTTLKYVEPASAFAGTTEPKLVTTTVKDYDLEQVKSGLKGVLQGIAMMGFMHLYMKYTNPLLIQSILPLKSAFEANIVKIHLWGSSPTGDLKRPFKAPSMFGGASGATEVKTDKKAIEELEKAGKGGIKEE